MKDEQFEKLLRDAAHTYHRPPEPPLDDMWAEIVERSNGGTGEREKGGATARWRSLTTWIALAATLVIGIAIGRTSTRSGTQSPKPSAPASPLAVAPPEPSLRLDTALSSPYEAETSKYLGQATALLMALPSEVKTGRADDQFLARAGDLLTTTRLLLDSPAANDGSMRALLEDLELVLAQVVRLQDNHSRTELDLVNQALEQRDVIPRLRTAAADLSAD